MHVEKGKMEDGEYVYPTPVAGNIPHCSPALAPASPRRYHRMGPGAFSSVLSGAECGNINDKGKPEAGGGNELSVERSDAYPPPAHCQETWWSACMAAAPHLFLTKNTGGQGN